MTEKIRNMFVVLRVTKEGRKNRRIFSSSNSDAPLLTEKEAEEMAVRDSSRFPSVYEVWEMTPKVSFERPIPESIRKPICN